MGIGLGRNSPIVLSQNRANFESLITRHGQWVRWRTARRCPCTTESGQPDIHCEKCGGTGEIYDCQKDYLDTIQIKVRGGIFTLPAENTDCQVLKVYDAKTGDEFAFVQSEEFVEITGGARAAIQNETLECLICESLVKHIASAALEKVGGGFYRVAGVESAARKLDGVCYKASGDVLAAESVETEAGESVSILGYRQNMLHVDSDADALTAYGVDYILPFKFIMLSQELNRADARFPPVHTGDAACTFPYMFNVSEGDVITVLSGMETAKAVINKKENADDKIPEFFVSAVESLETKERAYQEGVDFALTGTNYIHWLTDERPAGGAVMSLVYRYCPTYRVAQNIPNLRTSEDQRIPRKVVLKLFSAYQESRGVERNGEN
jgi:hypothetical protein